MSVWSVIGGALGGAAGFLLGGPAGAAIGYGLGSSAGGSFDTSNAVEDANDTRLQIARENNATSMQIAKDNNALQVSENEKSRNFSAGLQKDLQQREFDQQKAMWDLQTNYNSPVEQVKRLREAGLNPQLAMNGNGVMISSQSMPSVPSAPSVSPVAGVSPSMPVLQGAEVQPVPAIGLSQIDALTRLAEAKKSLKDADLSAAQSREVDSLLDEKLRGLKLVNDAQDMANKLKQDMLPLLKENQGKRYLAEVAVLTEQAFMYKEQGKTEESKRAYNSAQTALAKAEKSVKKQERRLFKLQADTYMQRFESGLAKDKSEINRNNADAELSREKAEEIRKLLPENFKIAQNNAGQSAVELVQAWEDYNNHKLTPEQKKLLQEKVTQELKTAIMDNSTSWWNPVQWVSTLISPLAREIGIAVGASANSTMSNSTRTSQKIIKVIK